jgi:hypothetical protein
MEIKLYFGASRPVYKEREKRDRRSFLKARIDRFGEKE